MLTNEQILHLLARCESSAGISLNQIRGNLASRGWLSAVWELVVMDAVSQIASVTYEPKTGSSTNPDLYLEFTESKNIWLEAVFLFTTPNNRVDKVKDHPVFRRLREKAGKASKLRTEDPLVVCMGTDRVWELNAHSPSRYIGRDDAVWSLFEKSSSLSGVILVPALLDHELFTGIIRQSKPALIINPNAINPLSTDQIENINHFDFNRWKFTPWTDDNKIRKDLQKIIRELGSDPAEPPVIDTNLLPTEPVKFSSPVWHYQWQFNHLKITLLGDNYWLIHNGELKFKIKSPEEAAQIASELFQPSSRLLLTPNGTIENPDKGVPSDLNLWTLETP